jgi:hypothetical protein
MDFLDAGFIPLLAAWTASTDVYERAEAHNIKFEERLHRDRLMAFERSFTSPCRDYLELRDRLADFVRTYVEVAQPHVSATFATAAGTRMTIPSPEQKLVRIENITNHLLYSGLTLSELEKSLNSAKPSRAALAESFVDRWNLARDGRPTFAAFKDQLVTEIDEPDWPNRLRDRLGLSHYSAAGGPLHVALMEYSVEEVIEETKRSAAIDHPFCFPTFLDMRPSPYFFPTPRELPAAAPMALFEVYSDDMIVAEMLHARLTYKRQHIVKVGTISTNTPLVVLKTLRNNHRAVLQLAALRDDFGEEL